MSLGARPEPRPVEHNPQWGVASHGEPRWPASLAVIAALILFYTLPERFVISVPLPAGMLVRSNWLLPVLDLALLIPLSIAAPRRNMNEPRWQRYAAVALIALINAANLLSLIILVDALLHGGMFHGGSLKLTGATLIQAAIQIWLTNILVFALWYWELDRGGPDERSHALHRQPDFLFPQMTTPGCTHDHWTPSFLDYLYVASTNAAAFSPTDTMPLTPAAKMLMLAQSLASLLTLALVAARAVNILA